MPQEEMTPEEAQAAAVAEELVESAQSEYGGDVVAIAEHLLRKQHAEEGVPMEAVRLHFLLAMCQSWSIAWTGQPLFPSAVEAWPEGYAVPDVAVLHGDDMSRTIVPGQLSLAQSTGADKALLAMQSTSRSPGVAAAMAENLARVQRAAASGGSQYAPEKEA